MSKNDFRLWLAEQAAAGELRTIKGAHWDQELHCLTLRQRERNGNVPALLFDEIEGYPAGYRVLTRALDGRKQVALALGLDPELGNLELMKGTAAKLVEWEKVMPDFPPVTVENGPILENVDNGQDVNVFKFPVPKYNALDGGRYIGTSSAVITRDPETNGINIGTYRIMIHDEKTVGLHVSPGKHGSVIVEKYHEQGKPCPVLISVGHHPMLYGAARLPIPYGMEWNFLGAIQGERSEVIQEEITGLTLPPYSEIVLAGWCRPGAARLEGPFSEWTDYYASSGMRPVVDVERVYYRNEPVQLGLGLLRTGYFGRLMNSAMLYNDLLLNGVPDVKGVWLSEAAMQLLTTVSIKQRYAGHAKRAAILASNCRRGAYFGRYVVVVDDDIDPTNIEQVLWAMCFRSDPVKDIDIIRRTWSTPLDPIIRRPADGWHTSRAIIDATRSYERKDEFAKVIKFSPEIEQKILAKWKHLGLAVGGGQEG